MGRASDTARMTMAPHLTPHLTPHPLLYRYCSGLENYSRHLAGRKQGQPPLTLLDYFPPDQWNLLVDESHVSLPQAHSHPTRHPHCIACLQRLTPNAPLAAAARTRSSW